jgi:hypothetical protein
MAISELLYLSLISLDEHPVFITMVRSWLIKLLLCFSHTQYNKKQQQQQQKPAPCFMMTNQEESQTVPSHSSTYHIFSSPLKLSMLRKVHCRIRPRIFDNNLVTLPLSIAPFKQQPVASFLNESQNCAKTLRFEHMPSTIRCKQYSSLIAIDIGNNELSQEQATNKYVKQTTNFYSFIDKSKSKDKFRLRR